MTTASFLIKESSSHIPYPFTSGYVHPKNQMTHYIMNHTFFPRQGNFSLLTQVDVEIIWLIENKFKVNWEKHVIEYMIESKSKGNTSHMEI